ncbi:MAG TPA: helix-turn-helix domain-containing protein, partial [Nocardioidaceae bacterium]|nr:helix-turn-helix domain-containing protein [Nocardioidaceae bacterium]
MRDLGAVVRDARRAKRLSQAALASRAGVSRDSVVRLEQGRPRLETQLVLDVLAAAGVVLTANEADDHPADEVSTAWDAVFA